MTTRFLFLALLATFARALLAHGCGEAFRMILAHFAPGMPPVLCIAIGLVLGVILIEIVALLWHRHTGSNVDPESRVSF